MTTAIEATRKGAFHYLQKPIRAEEVRHSALLAFEKKRLSRRVAELEEQLGPDFPNIVGASNKIREIKRLILRIRESDANVLITGESGVGKELAARAIHESSNRCGKRFLAFNCASFTDELVANELFGHEKDAFTGAGSRRLGLLESADGGTVFFDEVGDMTAVMQSKLLRVVQEKELLRVGGATPVPIDIRIVAATNKDLKNLIEAGIFRRDLFFRLSVIPIRVPTLAERREDVPLLSFYFLDKFKQRTNKKLGGFSSEALGLLTSYGYPGNVRELENIIERAASFAQGPMIEIGDLPADLKEFDSYTFHYSDGRMKTLQELEFEYIQWVLERVDNKKSEAARVLGIDRVSLYRKLKRYEFDE